MEQTTAKCNVCEVEKELNSFSTRANRKPRNTCKDCVNQQSKLYRQAHTIKIREYELNRNRDPLRVSYKSKHDKNRPERKKDKKEKLFCNVYFNVCQETGQLFTARISTARYSKEGLKIRALKAYHVKPKLKNAMHTIVCKGCGMQVQVSMRRKECCSVKCQLIYDRRISRSTYRAKTRMGSSPAQIDRIDPFVVFERDHWKCQSCGCLTPKDKRGTRDDDAPELDHIIPIANGGSHTLNNVQCLCRKCNIFKGNS